MHDPNEGLILILRRTQPWVSFLALVGFLSVVLIVIVGVAGGIVGVTTERGEATLLLIYPVASLLYLFPSIYLYKYARRIGVFIAQGHTVQLEAALDAQRAFWKFVGVAVLVAASLAVLVLVAAAIVGGMAGSLI
jgi:hypothetical protein